MEIDFRTSDALSRAHFAIVQQVENASSPQGVDAMIRNEISTIRAKLQDPNTSSVCPLSIMLFFATLNSLQA